MAGVDDDFTMFVAPFGNYVDIDRGLALCVSSWKRSDDNAIPPRAKVTGNYVNSALIKNEALLNGYDEGIVLSQQGNVVEGTFLENRLPARIERTQGHSGNRRLFIPTASGQRFRHDERAWEGR